MAIVNVMIDRKTGEAKQREAGMKTKTERIIYYLTDLMSGREKLKDRPYIILEDMAVVFGILDTDRFTVHKIDDQKAETEGWSVNELWETAKKNTQKLLPARIEPVSKNIVGHTEDEPVFLLSNDVRSYGAGVICYENLLHDFACRYQYNLYLLPTSIHEFVVLFDQGRYRQENLKDMIRESNKTLKADEILSDNIYYYDRIQKKFFALF